MERIVMAGRKVKGQTMTESMLAAWDVAVNAAIMAMDEELLEQLLKVAEMQMEESES